MSVSPLSCRVSAALIALSLCAPMAESAHAHPHHPAHPVRSTAHAHHAKAKAQWHAKRHAKAAHRHRWAVAGRHKHRHHGRRTGIASGTHASTVIADYYCTGTRSTLRVRYHFKGETPVAAQLTYMNQTHQLQADRGAGSRGLFEDILRFNNLDGYEWSTTHFTRSTFSASEAYVLTRGHELQTKSCKRTHVSL